LANNILIISDIHANLAALQAAVADFITQVGEPAAVWCMGDIVDYGAEPNEVIAMLQEFPTICVAGNHELTVLGQEEVAMFNPDARKSVAWTQQHLNADSFTYLRGLPRIITVATDNADFTLAHGSPRDPAWEYLLESEEAADNFIVMETTHGLIGHSHLPLYFKMIQLDKQTAGVGRALGEHDDVLKVGNYQTRERLLINPGGLGQPRNGDPRASYIIYDAEAATMRYRRVAYDIKATQAKIRAAKLPERFARRLERGT
jgi:predicted phosphodiesterase